MVTAKNAVKAVGYIGLITLLSKIVGFVREMVIANYFGATAVTDAYNIAGNIPTVLLAGLASAVGITFIPAFANKMERDGREAAFELGRKLMTAFTLGGLVLCALGIACAPWITRLMAPYFDRDNLALATELSRLLLLTGAFTILSGFCTGLLQAQERFLAPAAIGIPASLIIIAAAVLPFARHNIVALTAGAALGPLAQVVFQAPSIRRTGFPFRPLFDPRDPEVKRVALLTLPVFGGTALMQVNTIIDRIFASRLPAGSISAINYAQRTTGLISGIVVLSVATVALPMLSQAAATRNLSRLRRTMVTSMRGLNALVIPMTVGLAIMRVPVVRLLFERGAFDAGATAMTSTALLFISLGLFALGMRQIASRVFFSLQDTTTPMINAAIVIGLNIVLIFALVPRYGLAGLTGAGSLSWTIGSAVLLGLLRRKLTRIGGRELLISLVKTVVASGVMGVVIYLMYPVVSVLLSGTGFMMRLAALAVTSLLGTLVYLSVLWILRAREISICLGLLRRQPGFGMPVNDEHINVR